MNPNSKQNAFASMHVCMCNVTKVKADELFCKIIGFVSPPLISLRIPLRLSEMKSRDVKDDSDCSPYDIPSIN